MDTGNQQPTPASNPGLDAAVKAAGSQSALAKAIGRRQASVWEWCTVTGRVSAEDAIAIERVTGVPAEAINPALHEYAQLRRIKIRKAA